MKKLSVLVALMLIITVGGVYATWNYAQATGAVADTQPVGVSVRLAGIDYDEDNAMAKGTISIKSNTVDLIIDQDKPSYNATWGTDSDGAITGTFEPAANASDTVKASGTPLQFTLSGADLPNGLTISNSDPVDISYDRHENGIFYWTITAEQIANAISLAGVNLPTEASYDAFMSALGNAEITITISEYTGGNINGEGPHIPK